MQFHEDISDFISTFSKQQIRNLQKHLYDFEEFEELKTIFKNQRVCQEKCVSNLNITKK